MKVEHCVRRQVNCFFAFWWLGLSLSTPAFSQTLRFEKAEQIAPSLSMSVTVVPTGNEKAPPAKFFPMAFDEIRLIHKHLDAKNPSGELSALNKAAGKNSVSLTPTLLKLFRSCDQFYQWTHGVFDIVRGKSGDNPEMKVDFDAGTASLPKGAYVNLSGVLRGYLVDRMIGILKREKYSHAMAVSGEDYRTIGRDAGGYWKVTIPDPMSGKGQMLCRVSVESTGIATANRQDLAGAITRVGKRPNRPTDLESVTVLALNTTTADVLASTTLLVGKERALQILSKVPSEFTAAILQDDRGKVTPIGNVTAACLED